MALRADHAALRTNLRDTHAIELAVAVGLDQAMDAESVAALDARVDHVTAMLALLAVSTEDPPAAP